MVTARKLEDPGNIYLLLSVRVADNKARERVYLKKGTFACLTSSINVLLPSPAFFIGEFWNKTTYHFRNSFENASSSALTDKDQTSTASFPFAICPKYQ